MSAVLTFDSTVLPKNEGFDTWREMYCLKIFGMDVINTDARPYLNQTKFLSLGSMVLGSVKSTSVDCMRTLAQARAGGDDMTLHICLSGGFHAIQKDGSASLSEFGGILSNNGAAMSISTHPLQGQNYHQVFCLQLPRAEILARAPRAERRMLDDFRDQEPFRLLVGYLRAHQESVEMAENPALSALMGNHVMDLLALLLGPSRDAQWQAERHGLRAARLAALRGHIQNHYQQPGFSVKTVATALGISGRYIHNLMAESGESFTESVNRLRLERAKQMLVSPACRRMRIGNIALEVGFNDLSYFNRMFRRRFGHAPRAFREDQAGSADSAIHGRTRHE